MRLSSSAEWREDSRLSRQIARKETDPERKLLWAGHALTLALLAEWNERHREVRERAASLRA